MKVTCTECDQEVVTMGAHYEQNYRGKEDEYVCLICTAKKPKITS